MKRILSLWILLIGGFLYAGQARAQVHLSIDTLVNFPDTAYDGTIAPAYVIVHNYGNTPYQGPLQILLQADSLPAQYLNFNSTSITILPFDTAVLSPGGSVFVFDSAHFRTGNNVVVVWPYSTQSGINIDTFHTQVYFQHVAVGLASHPQIRNLQVYPNPANDFLIICSPDEELEGVRIMDISGKICRTERFGSHSTNRIPLSGLKPGCYLLEAFGGNNKRAMMKLMITQ
jgi:hypothetical protein